MTMNLPPAPLDQKLSAQLSAERLMARIADVSEMAGGVQRLLDLGTRSNSLAELQQQIQADPSLVAQILRRINSPYYGMSQEIHDLAAATRLLGFAEARNLAITVHLSRLFEHPLEYGTFSCGGLWHHSVAVAAAAQLVSRVCGCAIPAEAYLAGLFHDIGLLLVGRQLRRHFLQVIAAVSRFEATSPAERRVYRFDHAQLGAFVAERWCLPAAMVDTIRYHHEVDHYSGPHRDLVFVVATANYLCSRAGWTSMGVHNVAVPPDHVYRQIGLDQLALSVIWEQLLMTLQQAVFLASC
jgi:putative nucleotidyltransferase with HDIG domain